MTVNVRPNHYNTNCVGTGTALMSFPMSVKREYVAHQNLGNIVSKLVRMIEESGKPLTQQCKVVTALKQQLIESLPDTPEGRALGAEMARVMQTMIDSMNRTVVNCEETQKAYADCSYLKFNSTHNKDYYVTLTTADEVAAGSYSMTLTPSTGRYTTTATKKGRFDYQLAEDEAGQVQKTMSAVYTALADELGEREAHKILTQAIRHAESPEHKL